MSESAPFKLAPKQQLDSEENFKLHDSLIRSYFSKTFD